MEINNNTLNRLNPYQVTREKQDAGAARSAQKPEAAQPQGDRISLSPEARLRTEALSAATNAPEVRQAKVDAIKAEVDAGTYKPNSRQIASKMLAQEPGLFRAAE